MGVVDAIVDLVSSGTTLKENDLKEIKGGIVLESQVSYLGPCQASDFVVSRMLLKEGLQATAFVIVNFALSLSHLVIQHSSGCSCCKSESIDPEERCIGHNTRDS